MLNLYHGRTSVCSIKARLALDEKGVKFENILMTLRGDQFDPGYMKLNPNAVVPTLVHDGRVVIESTVIMHYVDEAFAGAAEVGCELVDLIGGINETEVVEGGVVEQIGDDGHVVTPNDLVCHEDAADAVVVRDAGLVGDG